MSARITLPTTYLRFPQRCVHCGNAPECEASVTASRGIDVLLFRWTTEVTAEVPACKRCRRRRRIVGILTLPAFLIIFTLLLLSVPLLEKSPLMSRPVILGIVGSAIVVLLYIMRNHVSSWLDRGLLGIRGVSLTASPPTITMVFRDSTYAHEVETLTENCRTAALRDAEAYLAKPRQPPS